MAGWTTAVQAAQQVVTAFGVLVAGSWAYLKFIRGRVYAPRAELSVAAEILGTADRRMLLVRVSLANSGLTRLRLRPDRKLATLHVSRAAETDRVVVPAEEKVAIARVLAGHDWLEGQEKVGEEVCFQLPADAEGWFGVRVEVEVWTTARRFRRSGQRWGASATVPGPTWSDGSSDRSAS
ncbi:MAG: hypothetical protein HOY78_18760 [Saccharothrix sp.]|nr:hypothetical protein [Saccharothrix sp.]